MRARICGPQPYRVSALPDTQPLAQRLALGTAQFGLAYGLNNQTGQPSKTAVAEVLAAAQAAGLTLLDTAAAYGNSEARLGELVGSNAAFDLLTKLPAGPPAQVAQHLREALTRLRPALAGAAGRLAGASSGADRRASAAHRRVALPPGRGRVATNPRLGH
ncbi:MAG: hypothetical protein EOO59_22115 [Hymenobacter sp.]|nr:MAG: hypothetical protein EOO59_22115 [Hymenobacter sp.]